MRAGVCMLAFVWVGGWVHVQVHKLEDKFYIPKLPRTGFTCIMSYTSTGETLLMYTNGIMQFTQAFSGDTPGSCIMVNFH